MNATRWSRYAEVAARLILASVSLFLAGEGWLRVTREPRGLVRFEQTPAQVRRSSGRSPTVLVKLPAGPCAQVEFPSGTFERFAKSVGSPIVFQVETTPRTPASCIGWSATFRNPKLRHVSVLEVSEASQRGGIGLVTLAMMGMICAVGWRRLARERHRGNRALHD